MHLEATTRSLETPAEAEMPTQPAQPLPTAPTEYVPPYASPVPAPATNSLAPEGQKRTVVILAALVAFLFFALVALGLFTLLRGGDGATPPPVITIPEPPPPPDMPGHPPDMPGHPPPPPIGGETGISETLIYPGAEKAMEQIHGGKVVLLQLRTADPMDKVAGWYEQRLRPKDRVNIPGPARHTIMHAEKATVIIQDAGEGTSIMITGEGKGN
ncbi:MAG TPA: hypothetical protein VNO70_01775 [Blastocatellia bacterium]|nr:hypothetical protein [Blastocatellia bacterium]